MEPFHPIIEKVFFKKKQHSIFDLFFLIQLGRERWVLQKTYFVFQKRRGIKATESASNINTAFGE